MTVTDFIRKLVEISRSQPRPVTQVDFEPSPDGIRLTFKCKEIDTR